MVHARHRDFLQMRRSGGGTCSGSASNSCGCCSGCGFGRGVSTAIAAQSASLSDRAKATASALCLNRPAEEGGVRCEGLG